MTAREDKVAAAHSGHWLEVLAVFLRLGLTSFGGPVAHLGYFRDEFVHRRRWLDDRGYAWSRSASSCPGRRRARWASLWASCAPAISGRSRRGLDSRCRRRRR
jgi:chromate transporter